VNKVKILILTANPRNTDPLRLNEEIREIEAEMERARLRDQFAIISKGAVRVSDLSYALLQHQPTIVHFSGHGAGEDGLILEDDNGQVKAVPTDALVELFRQNKGTVKCVFLNACYSKVQANTIYQQIDCVVGMTKAIGDKTAIQFAPKFYAALGHGRSFQDAFDYAKNVLQLDKNSEVNTPVQHIRQETVNLFPIPQPMTEPNPIASQSPETAPHSSKSIGNISITGNSNASNILQGDGNTVSQNINHSTTSSSDALQAAIAALAQLKKAIANTDSLGSYEKKRTKGDVDFIEEEVQKQRPDKSGIDQAIAALKQSLSGVVTLAEPVTKVAELIAKAWMV
jgi:hypothetical protein